jgi:hypothetical protein
MGTLDNLNSILQQLKAYGFTIGITLGGLMISIYVMMIMLTTDNSPMANRNKWDNLQKVLICAGILAGTGALMQFAQSLGSML